MSNGRYILDRHNSGSETWDFANEVPETVDASIGDVLTVEEQSGNKAVVWKAPSSDGSNVPDIPVENEGMQCIEVRNNDPQWAPLHIPGLPDKPRSDGEYSLEVIDNIGMWKMSRSVPSADRANDGDVLTAVDGDFYWERITSLPTFVSQAVGEYAPNTDPPSGDTGKGCKISVYGRYHDNDYAKAIYLSFDNADFNVSSESDENNTWVKIKSNSSLQGSTKIYGHRLWDTGGGDLQYQISGITSHMGFNVYYGVYVGDAIMIDSFHSFAPEDNGVFWCSGGFSLGTQPCLLVTSQTGLAGTVRFADLDTSRLMAVLGYSG
jgi:hypothetical protein